MCISEQTRSRCYERILNLLKEPETDLLDTQAGEPYGLTVYSYLGCLLSSTSCRPALHKCRSQSSTTHLNDSCPPPPPSLFPGRGILSSFFSIIQEWADIYVHSVVNGSNWLKRSSRSHGLSPLKRDNSYYCRGLARNANRSVCRKTTSFSEILQQYVTFSGPCIQLKMNGTIF